MDAQANNVLRHLKKQVIESEIMYLASVVTVTTVPPGTDTTPKSQTWAQPTGWPLSHQCLTAQRSKSRVS